MSSLSQRDSASNVTLEFEGGFDPSPKTNAGLREVFAPAVQPSRREREFKAWQSEGRSKVTRRSLLAAPLALLAAPALAFKNAPTKPPRPSIKVRKMDSGLTVLTAPTGSFAAARLQRQFKSGDVNLNDGLKYRTLAKITSDRVTCLYLAAA